MATFRRSVALAASAVVENILAGSEFEFTGVPAVVAVAAVFDTATTGVVEMDVQFGQEVQASRASLPLAATALTGPRIPDDNIVKGVVPGGDRIIVRLRETAAAAAVARVSVEITPI